jgi:NIL domain
MTIDNRTTEKRIRVRIPKDYRQEPVISRLVSDYGLVVNISAAVLGANGVGDGWFDLGLKGTETKIDRALVYLHDLALEVWGNSDIDGW